MGLTCKNSNIKKELVGQKINLRVIENEGKSRILVKEVSPNILSTEAEKFLNSFFRILEEQISKIDEGVDKLGYKKFLNGKFRPCNFF